MVIVFVLSGLLRGEVASSHIRSRCLDRSLVRLDSIRGRGLGGSVPGGGDLGVFGLGEGGRLGAVNIEPPVADEVVLVEDGSVGAEEAVLGETSSPVSCADVEHLALGLLVSIVTWIVFIKK